MIRTEYNLVCDECSVWLGEDQGDDDMAADDAADLLTEAEHRGWTFLENGEHHCKTCSEETDEEAVPVL